MKKLFLLITLSSAILVVSSCKKTPVACISADKNEALIDENITFTSCATDANRTVWDFGDGSEKTEGETVSHVFTKEGVYLVTGTSYSKKDKKTDKTSVLITVNAPPPAKERYLTKIVLKSFPNKKLSGSDWDGTSFGQTIEPEIFVILKLASGGSWQLRTSTLENAAASMLPYTWDYAPQNVFMVDADWVIEMNDDDVISTELMTTWNSNLATVSATDKIITLTDTSNPSGNAVIELHFVEK